jgi:hypothetical protein
MYTQITTRDVFRWWAGLFRQGYRLVSRRVEVRFSAGAEFTSALRLYPLCSWPKLLLIRCWHFLWGLSGRGVLSDSSAPISFRRLRKTSHNFLVHSSWCCANSCFLRYLGISKLPRKRGSEVRSFTFMSFFLGVLFNDALNFWDYVGSILVFEWALRTRGMILTGKLKYFGDKPVPLPLRLRRIPHGLDRNWIGATAESDRRLTTSAMARFCVLARSVYGAFASKRGNALRDYVTLLHTAGEKVCMTHVCIGLQVEWAGMENVLFVVWPTRFSAHTTGLTKFSSQEKAVSDVRFCHKEPLNPWSVLIHSVVCLTTSP